MSATLPLAQRAHALVSDADWKHGLRLAIAVISAFLVSSAFGLPESFWAVMSALIVVRPTTGSALGAGWDRVRGTMIGTVVGLGGVWLHHVGLAAAASTLAIVAGIAFLSAIVPALRAAPISALIVLTSSGIAGHSALDVAALRAIEISIGVATGLVVSVFAFATHARTRFEDACAAWLRGTAERTAADLRGTSDPTLREARQEASRVALRRIAELAVGAEREARWLRALHRGPALEPRHRVRARLLVRIASDAGAMVRAAAHASPADATRGDALAALLHDALQRAADGTPGAVDRAVDDAVDAAVDAAVDTWMAASWRLLQDDLAQWRRLTRASMNKASIGATATRATGTTTAATNGAARHASKAGSVANAVAHDAAASTTAAATATAAAAASTATTAAAAATATTTTTTPTTASNLEGES